MKGFLVVTAVTAVLSLIPSSQGAPYCVGYDTIAANDFLEKKNACGAELICPQDYFCDETATCVAKKTQGSCLLGSHCARGYGCNGPVGAKTCVKNASPGESCVISPLEGSAVCGSGLSCSIITEKCTGGKYNDACTAGEDCNSGTCTNGACAASGVLGQPCPLSGCEVTTYCDTLGTGNCEAKKADGQPCEGAVQCTSGLCLSDSRLSTANSRCVGKQSLAAEAFCDDESNACQSGLCYKGNCLSNDPPFCSRSSGCTGTKVCTCDKTTRQSGFGTCADTTCSKLNDVLQQCLQQNCKGIYDRSYSGSCGNRLCAEADANYVKDCVLV